MLLVMTVHLKNSLEIAHYCIHNITMKFNNDTLMEVTNFILFLKRQPLQCDCLHIHISIVKHYLKLILINFFYTIIPPSSHRLSEKLHSCIATPSCII